MNRRQLHIASVSRGCSDNGCLSGIAVQRGGVQVLFLIEAVQRVLSSFFEI
jgi:hypothetical protein